eukprot:s2_g42.t1
MDSPAFEPMKEGTQVLDQAREVAVEQVVCPICFEALSDLPNQVGALSFEGHRVETALYHRECVLNPVTRRLIFESSTGRAVSPLTRQQVDNFKLMPSLTESEAWVDFVDWNCDGHLDIQEVCFTVAALLPVDDAYARKFVLRVMNLPEDSEEKHELDKQEVIHTLLPQIRRQLRRLVATPRPRPPQICRNSKQDELVAWFQFWDSKKQGHLDTATLTLAVVSTFHTALARSADAATKDAVAHTFLMELGLRETDTVTESQFMEKMAPQLVANLPVALERGEQSGSFDPKLPLTLILRDMKTAAERPLHFEEAGQVTVGELRKATLRRFPVILCRRKVKLFVMGQLLEDDTKPLMHLRGIYAGATVNFMPGERVADPILTATKKKKKILHIADDLDGFDSSSSEDPILSPAKCKSLPASRVVSKDLQAATAQRASSLEAAPKMRAGNRRASIKGITENERASSSSAPTPKAKPEPKKEPRAKVPKQVSWRDLPEDVGAEEAEAAIVPASQPCTLLTKGCDFKTLHFWLHI